MVDGDNHITRKVVVYNVIKRRKMECAVNVAGMGQVRNPNEDLVRICKGKRNL